MKEFLAYWTEDNISLVRFVGGRAKYHGSRRFPKDLAPGDRLWIVNVKAKKLRLLAPIEISSLQSRNSIEKLLRTSNLYDAPQYVVAKSNGELIKEVDISSIVDRIIVASKQRALIRNKRTGLIDPQQFRTILEITAQSGELLASLWNS